MTTTVHAQDIARRDALVEQIFRATMGAQEVMHIYLGYRLGLYRALADVESVSATDLAQLAGIAPRYAREWLEQQAATGVLDVAADGDADTRRFRMPPGAADVLCEPDSPYLMAPMTALVVGIGQALPQVAAAFRTGDGVPYEAFGKDARVGIAELNRPMYIHQLAADWIPAMPDIEARLRRTDPPARVADLGCGTGWSTLALAKAFPSAEVEGIDVDPASIEEARRNAERSTPAGRVSFVCEDAGEQRHAGRYDLVMLFETLHDMPHPVRSLRTARAMLAPGGAVLVGDERVAETFTAPAEELDRFNYGWSAVHCLPVGLVEPDAAGTGTVIRPDTVRRYAAEAGFAETVVLPIEHDFWRFYRLNP